MQALPDLPDEGTLMVLCGDVPLLTAEHLKTLLKIKKNCSVVVASVIMADPTGYGRIVRGNGNQVLRIVEEKDASAEEKQITEINTGTYCFDLRLLKHYLPLVNNINAQGEYYLTDVVAALSGEGHSVESYQLDEPCLGLGINTRLQLAEAASVMRERICHRLMMQGVTIEDPGSTYIDDKVEVGPDTIIRPGSVIEKGTRVGSRCIIGPYSHLVNAEVGDEALIEHASVKNTLVNSGEYIGPYTVKDR
jgi:bifunctional UDP-N-acetylglucosamine pyrophosphorylase/glucosamine-1-phosphate N-acetyltransferase